jgi:hypothetical protein
MTGIKDWSSSAITDDAYFPENQSPGSVNNGARQVKADVREWYNDAEWVEYGVGSGAGNGGTNYTVTALSDTQFTIGAGDTTGRYHAGRRIRASGVLTPTIIGTIAGATYSGGTDLTTVTVDWDSDGLELESGLRVWTGIVSANSSTAFPAAALRGQDVDLGGATLDNVELKNYAETRVTLASASGVVSWSLTDGNAGYLVLTENVTQFTISNWPTSPAAGSFTLWVQQDSTGGWTMTGYPNSVKWLGDAEPVITDAAFAVDIISFMTLDGGANIVGIAGQRALFTGLIGS